MSGDYYALFLPFAADEPPTIECPFLPRTNGAPLPSSGAEPTHRPLPHFSVVRIEPLIVLARAHHSTWRRQERLQEASHSPCKATVTAAMWCFTLPWPRTVRFLDTIRYGTQFWWVSDLANNGNNASTVEVECDSCLKAYGRFFSSRHNLSITANPIHFPIWKP